jgi:hypothetical protein
LEEPGSNLYPDKGHLNIKMSELDQRFSPKCRTGQHWFKPHDGIQNPHASIRTPMLGFRAWVLKCTNSVRFYISS